MEINLTQVWAFIQFLISIYPLSPFDTLTLVLVGKEMVNLAIKNEWKKLAKLAEEKALPLFNSAFENEERRDKVLLAMYNTAPGWFKKVVTYQQIDTFFDDYYRNRIKPKAEALGITDAQQATTPPAAHEAGGFWF